MAGDVIRISVDDVPARQRLAYLHDFVASQIAGLEFEPKDAGAFSFELLTSRLDGAMVLGRTNYNAVTGRRSRPLLADGRGDYILSIHDTDYEIESGGRSWKVRAGDVVIVDESHPFSFTLPGTRSTIVSLNRRRMAELAPRIARDVVHHMPADAPEAALLSGYVELVRTLPLQGGTGDIAGHIHALAARMLATQTGGDIPRESLGGARLAMVKADIDRWLVDPSLRIETLARRHKVSARYIQQLFAREGGSFSAHVRDRRVDRALARLEDVREAGRPIADIAFEAGFGDLSSFNRAFRARVGETPREFRARSMRRAVH